MVSVTEQSWYLDGCARNTRLVRVVYLYQINRNDIREELQQMSFTVATVLLAKFSISQKNVGKLVLDTQFFTVWTGF